jgi:hypothetical protein
MAAAAAVVRTFVNNRLGIVVFRRQEANQRRCGSARLRRIFRTDAARWPHRAAGPMWRHRRAPLTRSPAPTIAFGRLSQKGPNRSPWALGARSCPPSRIAARAVIRSPAGRDASYRAADSGCSTRCSRDSTCSPRSEGVRPPEWVRAGLHGPIVLEPIKEAGIADDDVAAARPIGEELRRRGLGKTMLAKSIVHQAILSGHSTLFTTAAELSWI